MSNPAEAKPSTKNGVEHYVPRVTFERPPARSIVHGSDDEIVRVFLRGVIVLEPDEERALAQQIEAGTIAKQEIETQSEMNPSEREAMERTIRDAQEARAQLIHAGERYIIPATQRYVHQGYTLGELINEGYFGVVNAVDKYDWHRGEEFSTRVMYFIRQSVMRAQANDKRDLLTDNLNKIDHAVMRLRQELGRDPSVEEIAIGLRMNVSDVANLLEISQSESYDSYSITGAEIDPERIVLDRMLHEDIEAMLEILSEEEQRVLEHVYGLHGQTVLGFRNIAKLLGIEQGRVVKIHEAALAKLRDHKKSLLADYQS